MGSRHIYLEFHDTVKLKILDILIVFCLLGLCFYIQAMRNNCNCFFFYICTFVLSLRPCEFDEDSVCQAIWA